MKLTSLVITIQRKNQVLLKNRINQLCLILCLILSGLSVMGSYIPTDIDQFSPLDNTVELKTSDITIIDNVYTLLAPSDNINFTNLVMIQNSMYYIYVEIVTPHNITNLRVRIWDPDGKQYNVFESPLLYDPSYANLIKIPKFKSRRENNARATMFIR